MKDVVRFKIGDIVENEKGYIGKVEGISVDIFYQIRTTNKKKSDGSDQWFILDKYGDGVDSLGYKHKTKVEAWEVIEGIDGYYNEVREKNKIKSRFEILDL